MNNKGEHINKLKKAHKKGQKMANKKEPQRENI